MTHNERRDWANHVISGKTPAEACLLVWPHISKKTASNRGGKLGKDEGLREYIREQSRIIVEKTTEKVTEGLAAEQIGTVLTAARKREILAQIASGEIETEKFVMVKGELKKVKSKPTLAERMHAIDLDNKMSGDHVQAKPNQTAKAQEVEKIIVVEDETQPGSDNVDEED